MTLSLILFLVNLAGIALLAFLGPAEKTLGVNVRVVYLHGAWVWASLAAFVAAGGVGAAGLLTRREILHRWSVALGRTGLLLWITYLPISLWAMQANWNGLFLAEPRWRLAVIFAVTGLLLQAGLAVLQRPVWTSTANLIFVGVLLLAIRITPNVMHPPAPIVSSEARWIQIFFGLLFFLILLAAFQIARWHVRTFTH